MVKMELQKSIISARLCFVRVSSRLGLVWLESRLIKSPASFTSLLHTTHYTARVGMQDVYHIITLHTSVGHEPIHFL